MSVLPKADISNQIDRAYKAPTLAGQFLKDNGLEDVIRNVDDLDGFEQYLVARQALDVASNGIETGRDLAKDKALVAAFGPRFEAEAEAVKEYSGKLLDYAVDSGLVGRETAAKLRAEYPNYVPINRIFAEGEDVSKAVPGSSAVASLSKQTVVRGLKGSAREIESPLASFASKTADAFIQGERNKAARLLAGYEQIGFPVRELGRARGGRTHDVQLPGQWRKADVRDDARDRIRRPQLGPAAIGVHREGPGSSRPRVQSRDHRLEPLVRGLQPVPRPADGGGQRQQEPRGEHPKVRHGLLQRIFGSREEGRPLRQSSPRGGDRKGGGPRAWPGDQDRRRHPVKPLRPLQGRVYGPQSSELLRAAEDVVGVTEEATRLQQFKGTLDKLIKEGRTLEDATILAAKAARENTTNFSRRGNYGRVLSATIPYINAAIQGKRTFLRVLAQDPKRAAARIAVSAGVPVLSVTAWNLSSPERRAAYEDIPDWEKQAHIIILPKPDEGR